MENKKSTAIDPQYLDARSRELIDSWNRHAERLKKRHPKWSAEKIQNEMKTYIAKQAREAIPEKGVEEYQKEIKAYYRKIQDRRNSEITKIAEYIGNQHPEAIGVAVFELDCGCIRACGVSADGRPVGEMIMVSPTPAVRVEGEDTTCRKCREDGGADPSRCIRQSIVWPGEESEMPDEELRLSIGKKVFGEAYSINDI